MIDEAEVERLRRLALESRYKRGTLGVWARHWLALYEWSLAAIVKAEDAKNEATNFCIRNHG